MATSQTIPLAFYPSPHGFGHFMRIVHLAQLILQQNGKMGNRNDMEEDPHYIQAPGYHIYVRTNVPPHIITSLSDGWKDIDSCAITFSNYTHPIQPAIVQTNPYTLSAPQTFESVRMFDAEAALTQEETFLSEKGVHVVVSDCPSIVCGLRGVACILVTNFLFDGILEGLVKLHREEENGVIDEAVQRAIQKMTKEYTAADVLLRLPGFIPMRYPSSKTVDIPAHFRKANASRVATLAPLGIPQPLEPGTKVLLHCFGGQPQQVSSSSGFKVPTLPPHWICLSQTIHFPPHFHKISSTAYIPNLIAASDAVLGKLGWGMCSEVLGNGRVPFIYVPRSAFVEEVGLLEWMHKEHRKLVKMEVEVFEGMDWEGKVREAETLGGGRGVSMEDELRGEKDEKEVIQVLEKEISRLLKS